MSAFVATWAEAMARATWQAILAAAFVYLVCRFVPRLPHTIRCALWWLVCLRMLIGLAPLTISLPASPPVPPSIAVGSADPLPLDRVKEEPNTGNASRSSSIAPGRPEVEPVPWTLWAMIVWTVGVGVLGGFTAFSLLRTYAVARRATPCDDPVLIAEADRIARELGMRARPRLLMTDSPSDVLALGAWRPAVLFSRPTLDRCSPEERQMILAHEFAHLRRGDGWLALVPQIARILFFFHPVAWLASREYDLAREADCDQTAIHVARLPSELYARLLLKLGVRREGEPTLCSPGVSSHFRLLRRRIAMLQQFSERSTSRPRRGVYALIAVAAVLCAAPVGIVWAQAPTTPPPPKEKPVPAARPVRRAVDTVAVEATRPRNVRKAPAAKIAPTVRKASAPPTQVQGASVRVFRLRNAKAAVVAGLLNRVFKEDVGIAPDPNGNLVVVRGSKEMLNQAADLIAALDNPPLPKEEVPRVTKIFALRHADAEQVAAILSGSEAGGKATTVAIDSRTNSIVATAPEDRMANLMDLIGQLDRPAEPKVKPHQETRILRLRHANAVDTVRVLVSFFDGKGASSITADPRTNSLVIRATADAFEEILDCVANLDVPAKSSES